MGNPFSDLGFNPQIFKGLKPDQVAVLVKAQYRALSMIHHPDRGGKEKKFHKISNAARQLDYENEPDEFNYWLKKYLKLRKDRLVDLEEELRQKEREVDLLRDRIVDFWSAMVGVPHEKLVHSIFHLRGVRMLISDVLKSRRLFIGSKPFEKTKRYDVFELVEENGQFVRYPVIKQKRNFDKQPIPDLPKGWIYKSDKQPWLSYFWKSTGTRIVEEELTIVGSIASTNLLTQKRDYGSGYKLLDGKSRDELGRAINEGIDPEMFRWYCSDMSPYFGKESILIGMKGNRIYIVGRVMFIADDKNEE